MLQVPPLEFWFDLGVKVLELTNNFHWNGSSLAPQHVEPGNDMQQIGLLGEEEFLRGPPLNLISQDELILTQVFETKHVVKGSLDSVHFSL